VQGPEQPLLETVAALRQEVAGLREAARLRAVIEQAKGVLVERDGLTLDQAFDHLRQLSQQHNVRVVEVAATIVGTTVPDGEDLAAELHDEPLRTRLPASPASSSAWDRLRREPEVRAGTLSALLDSVAGATQDGDEAARLVLDLLSVHEVAAVVLLRLSADGALRVVGQAGYPADRVSAWRSIPPRTDVPLVRTAETGRALFFADEETRGKEFPVLAAGSSGFEASASVPVVDAGRVTGVVGLSWRTSQAFDRDREDLIVRAVARVARLLLRHVAATDPELDWATSLLDVQMDPWLLLEAIPSADGVVRDFVVQAASTALPGIARCLGRRVVELWPGLVTDGTARALTELARVGGTWTGTQPPGASAEPQAEGAPWSVPGTTIRATRIGTRVVVLWREPGAAPGPAAPAPVTGGTGPVSPPAPG
jgi:hypothetical protein